MPLGGAQTGAEPSATLPSLRRSRARPKPERRRGQTTAREVQCGAVGPREADREGLARLRLRSRRRARRRRGWRRAVEPEPLEQDPQALAPGVHAHDPPPAAAARALKDVKGEHPAQKRRPRRTLTLRTPRPWRRLRQRPRPLARPRRRRPFIDSRGAPRNDPRGGHAGFLGSAVLRSTSAHSRLIGVLP
jgi:hypothetical protein